MNGESSADRSGEHIGSTSFSALTPDAACDILQDPATSYWLKKTYVELLSRDPVDALGDAYLLYQAMQLRCNALQV